MTIHNLNDDDENDSGEGAVVRLNSAFDLTVLSPLGSPSKSLFPFLYFTKDIDQDNTQSSLVGGRPTSRQD